MSETEELKTRIETIRALSGQLRERNRTVKSLEEEMTATAPEHAWSFGKKHHYNLLKAELEDERRLVLEDKYRLGSLSKDLFEDFNIVADKATSTNSLESMLDLIEQSLDTDPEYRESVSHQTGITDGTSYMRLVPQDNPEGMLPPTPWGRKAAEEAYRQDQVQQFDPQLKLLRTLATGSFKDYDTPETNDYLALMDFNEGDRVTMGPGLSTTVTTPHWLGAGGILLIIEGASKGSADGRQQGRRAQRERGLHPGRAALHRHGESNGRRIPRQEIRTDLPARRRIGGIHPFRRGIYWDSPASSRTFHCRIRPSTRIRQWRARTIRDSNYERMRDDRKPACGI